MSSLQDVSDSKVKSLEEEREMLMASVRSLAEFNLTRQQDYESDRSKLLDLVNECNKLRRDIEDKAARLVELSKKTSLESTLAVIQQSAKEADEESENLAKTYLEEGMDHDTFINQYLEKRKLAYMRRIKAERLQQDVRA